MGGTDAVLTLAGGQRHTNRPDADGSPVSPRDADDRGDLLLAIAGHLHAVDALALTSGLHPEDRDKLWPLFDEACRNVPHWLVQYGWDIAERFTHAAFTAHGVCVEPDGFRYAGAIKRKIDCNAVYKLLDEGLW